jgi:hypothetical protein
VTATPLERTWQDTVAWWRSRVGSGRLPAPDLRPA